MKRLKNLDFNIKPRSFVTLSETPARTYHSVRARQDNFFRGIIFIFLLSFQPFSIYTAERAELHFDDKPWKVVYMGAQASTTTTQFVPEKEDIETWTQMLTSFIHYAWQKQMNIETFAVRNHEKLERQCLVVKRDNIFMNENDALIEWYAYGCQDGFDYYYVDRMIAGLEAIHVVQYAIRNKYIKGKAIGKRVRTQYDKTKSFYEARRNLWIDCLKKVRILNIQK
ncbi:MAG: hypothetical protein Q8Q33_02915 [Chlamydiota bacterium]|nr:hypothetical protein [Chlamydiota bacterium]